MEKVLFAADELTGLIGAAALMRPSHSCQDMELKSLKKKYKDKKFAAGCSRDVIAQGAERLGWELDMLLERTLEAMRSCEEQVAYELSLIHILGHFVAVQLRNGVGYFDFFHGVHLRFSAAFWAA